MREYKTDIITVHRQVGLLLQVEAERSGGTDAKLTIGQFQKIVECHLHEEGHESESLSTLVASIIEAAAHRLVFLVGLEQGQVGFEIRSLQEFMAAEGLMAADDKMTQNRLKAIAGNTNWRNVFLFATGKCFFDRQYLRDTIHAVCSELNDDIEDRVARYTLAGSELALDVLEEGSARRQPRWNRMLTRTALRLLDDQFTDWAPRLANVWQKETSDVFLSEIRSRIGGSDPNAANNAWVCLSYLAEHDADFALLFANLLDSRNIDEELFQTLLVDGNHDSASLNGFLAGRILDYPASALARAQGPIRVAGLDDARQTWVSTPSAPDWLGPLANLLWFPSRKSGDKSIRITSGRKLLLVGRFPPILPTRLSEAIDTFPGGDQGWDAIRAYLDFMKSPNSDNLAKVLISAAREADYYVVFKIASLAPWPLAEALIAFWDPDSTEALVSAASSGALGDIDDWLTWQQDWFGRGVHLQQLHDGDIMRSGIAGKPWFPIRLLERESHNIPYPKDPRNLINAAIESPAGRVREFLASMALSPRGRASIVFDASFAALLDGVFETSPMLGVQLLCQVSPDALRKSRWVEAIAKSIRRNSSLHLMFLHDINERRYGDIMQQAWLDHPQEKELLLALSYVGNSLEPHALFLEKLIKLDTSEISIEVRLARIMLLLRCGYWNESLIAELRECEEDNPKELSEALHILLLAFSSSGSAKEDILVNLYESGILHTRWTGLAIRILREKMRSRQSVLTRIAAWGSWDFLENCLN
ncbi:hypothetical protein ACFQQB_25345 [Nonomuraea rubra]|uniref:hypothetical protein n=1 Tax=Nonomuraea rubra TaxID=46180 RepID=UPI0036179944